MEVKTIHENGIRNSKKWESALKCFENLKEIPRFHEKKNVVRDSHVKSPVVFLKIQLFFKVIF